MGSDRQIGDYLRELLAGQPFGLRDFLLQTSILERLWAPLCDAVTGRDDGGEQLDAADRSNLFLIPLDGRREWFRYHHLFRDLLRHELTLRSRDLVAELHRRASGWHRQHGDVDEAIHHATAAGDFGDAGELIARHCRPVWSSGQVETVAGWVDGLPRETVLADARLCLARGWAALYLHLVECDQWRRAAEVAPLPGPFSDGTASVEEGAAILHAAHGRARPARARRPAAQARCPLRVTEARARGEHDLRGLRRPARERPCQRPALTGASFARWWFFQYAQAIQLTNDLLAVDPDDVYGTLFRGSSRLLLGATKARGRADLERAIELAPGSPDVRFVVADAYTYGQPDPGRAFAEASLALQWGLDTPRVHALLAAALNAFGETEAAAGHIAVHIAQVTTELVAASPLHSGGRLTLDLVPGRTYAIPIPAVAGETIAVSTTSKDFWDSIAVLLAPDGTPVVGGDDDSAYFAAFEWVAEQTGVTCSRSLRSKRSAPGSCA